jgi:hypothetical protein
MNNLEIDEIVCNLANIVAAFEFSVVIPNRTPVPVQSPWQLLTYSGKRSLGAALLRKGPQVQALVCQTRYCHIRPRMSLEL